MYKFILKSVDISCFQKLYADIFTKKEIRTINGLILFFPAFLLLMTRFLFASVYKILKAKQRILVLHWTGKRYIHKNIIHTFEKLITTFAPSPNGSLYAFSYF